MGTTTNGFGILDPKVFFDRASMTLYLIGGETATGPLSHVWALNLATFEWTNTWEGEPNGMSIPAGMADTELALDASGKVAYMVQSSVAPVATHTFKIGYNGPQIDQLTMTDTLPAARNGAAVTYSDRTNSIVLFSGYEPQTNEYLDDLWMQDVHTGKWSELDSSLKGRENAEIVADATGEIYLIGGSNAAGEISMESALAYKLTGRNGDKKWRGAATGVGRRLKVDGVSYNGVFNPADSVTYTLSAKLDGEVSAGTQVVLKSDSDALELLAFSSTGFVKGSSHEATGLASFNLHAGEQWQLVIRSREGQEQAASGASFTLWARSADNGSLVGQLSTWPLTRFDVEGDTVYVADWNELGIYLRDGDSMSKVGSLSTSAAIDVEVIGTVALIADFWDGLVIVDISNPSIPVVLGTEWVLGTPDSIAVHGNNVYLGTSIFGVQVVNIEDLTSPAWEDTICVGDVVMDVSVSGSFLLIGDLWNGVEIFSIGRDGQAEQVGSYTSWGWVEDTAVHGSKLYVKDFGGMLEVVDLRTPSSPRREKVQMSGGVREVSMRLGHDIAVVPDGWKIKAYDVEVPGQ